MRFTCKTFKNRSRRYKKKKRTVKKQKGGCSGCVPFRGIPKEATFSDVMPNPLE